MTISEERSTEVSGAASGHPHETRALSWTQRPGIFSQNIITALVAGIIGYAIGHWFGNYLSSGYSNIANSGQNAIANTLALAFGVVGWLLGIGALNYPIAKMFGVDGLEEESPVDNWTKYFRYSLDHKVVGLQYVVGVLLFMFTGGLLAIRRAPIINGTK